MMAALYGLVCLYLCSVVVTWFRPWWFMLDFSSWAELWEDVAGRRPGFAQRPFAEALYRLIVATHWPTKAAREWPYWARVFYRLGRLRLRTGVVR